MSNSSINNKMRMDMFLFDILTLYSEIGNDSVINSYQYTSAYYYVCSNNCSNVCYAGYGYYAWNTSCVKNFTFRYPYTKYRLPNYYNYYYINATNNTNANNITNNNITNNITNNNITNNTNTNSNNNNNIPNIGNSTSNIN